MKKSLLITGALIIGMVLTGFLQTPKSEEVAQTPQSKRSHCVDIERLHSRRIIDRQTLYLRSSGGKAMLVRLSAPCAQMQEMDRLDFEMRGSSYLCSRSDIAIYHSRFGETPIRCLIAEIKPLTEKEWRAIEDN
jgi:hypothetical protein